MHISGNRTIDGAGDRAVVRSVGGAGLLELWKGGLGRGVRRGVCGGREGTRGRSR